MEDLRAMAEVDLADTLEGDCSMPIILIGPTGTSYPLRGRIDYDPARVIVDGEVVVTPVPVITLRRSSMTVVPTSISAGVWAARIPESPKTGSAIKTFLIDWNRAPEGSASLGVIRYFLSAAVQS
jgi:hypothetical protein